MKRACKILLLGFGQVGRRVCEILAVERNRYPQWAGLDLKFVGLFTGSHGAWVNPEGLDVAQALEVWLGRGQFPQSSKWATTLSSKQAAHTLDYDVLVELSTLSIEHRGQPALDHVRIALSRGCHTVTANKGPAAFALRELRDLARERQVQFRFESAVLDGTPVFNLQQHCLSAARPTRVTGILNCTSNFVLAQGLQTGNWEEALRQAQKQGFAEADPSLDLLGWDSAAKLAILSNVFLGADFSPLDIPRVEVNPEMIRTLKRDQKPADHWRVLGRAWHHERKIEARVELCNLDVQHPFRSLTPASGGLLIETDLTGPIFLGQKDPDLTDTAFGVLQDLWSILAGY